MLHLIRQMSTESASSDVSNDGNPKVLSKQLTSRILPMAYLTYKELSKFDWLGHGRVLSTYQTS